MANLATSSIRVKLKFRPVSAFMKKGAWLGLALLKEMNYLLG